MASLWRRLAQEAARHRGARLCAGLLGVLSGLPLIGWIFQIDGLVRLRPSWPGMSVPTAVGLLLLAASIGLSTSRAPRARRVGAALAGLALLGAVLASVARLTGTAVALGFAGPRASMAPSTALALALLGGAALLPAPRAPRLVQGLMVTAGAIGVLGVTRFTYGSWLEPFAAMAFHTSLSVLVAATGLSLLRPDTSLMMILLGTGGSGTLARRLLPATVLGPLLLSWLLADLQDLLHLLAPVASVALTMMAWWTINELRRRHTQDHLTEAQRFRQMFESSASGSLVVDQAGQIVLANPSAAAIFGYSVEELCAMQVEALIPQEHRAGHAHLRSTIAGFAASRAMAGGRTVTGLHKDGRKIATEVSLSPLVSEHERLTIASIRDVSAQRAAEREREEHHERFLLLSRATLDTMWEWDAGRDGIWLSDNFTPAFGWTVEGRIDRQWMRDRIHPEDLPRMASSLAELQASGGTLWTCEYRFRRRDGVYRHVLLRALLVRDAQGEISRIIGAMLDLTEHQAMEQALRERTHDLERSNAELERFAQVAAHDLQEPLRTISSFVQLLAKRYGDRLDEDGLRFVGHAVDGALRMRRLIDELLSYSRLDRPDAPITERVKLAGVMTRVQAALQTAIQQSGVRLTCAPLPRVQGNEAQLFQLFLNVISNALKYRRDQDPCVQIVTSEEGELCKISVIDNGIGIEAQYFDRIFILFQRLHTREAYEGTGVGLAICKRIVERHGGKIWLESQAGVGTTFYFTLRLAGEDDHAPHAKRSDPHLAG